MGLGLSIVDRLALLLKHPVELISRPGRGSRFAVAVPLAASGVAAEPLPSPASIGFEVSGKLILVIDDDQLVLDGMRGILQSWGCHVVLGKSSRDHPEVACRSAQGAGPDHFRLPSGTR